VTANDGRRVLRMSSLFRSLKVRPSGSIPGASAESLLVACRGPLLVVAIGYALLLYVLLAEVAFNPTGPIHIGRHFDGRRFWDQSTVVHPGVGYDGQFYYYLARDPLLRASDPGSFLDRPAYRYARVLYPLLAWAAALGQASAIPWMLLGVSLGAVVIGTVAAVDVVRLLGASRWLALVFAFSPAVMVGLVADLTEPTTFALVAIGVALHLRGRHRAAGWTLALATLARETSLLVPLGFFLHAVWRRQWRESSAYALPQAVPAAWYLWIWARFGVLPAAQAPPNFGLPFSGAIYRAGVLLGWQVPLLGETAPASPFPELVFVGLSVAVILLGLTRLILHRDVFSLQLWLQAAAMFSTAALVWEALISYGRVLGLLYLFLGLALLAARVPPEGCSICARMASAACSLHGGRLPPATSRQRSAGSSLQHDRSGG